MNCDIVLGFIDDSDNESITIAHLQGRPRELPIHCNSIMGFAQPLHWRSLNLHEINQLILLPF